MIGRRGFITGMVSLIAAPAIVRVASIMPVKRIVWGMDFGLEPAIMAFDPETLEMVAQPVLRLTMAQWMELYGFKIEEMPALRHRNTA